MREPKTFVNRNSSCAVSRRCELPENVRKASLLSTCLPNETRLKQRLCHPRIPNIPFTFSSRNSLIYRHFAQKLRNPNFIACFLIIF